MRRKYVSEHGYFVKLDKIRFICINSKYFFFFVIKWENSCTKTRFLNNNKKWESEGKEKTLHEQEKTAKVKNAGIESSWYQLERKLDTRDYLHIMYNIEGT